MKATKRNLIFFILVTLASGWIGVLIDYVLTEQPEGNTLGMGVWLVLPFLTTILLRVISRDKKDLGIRLNMKENGKWYLFSLAIYPFITTISIGIGFFLGCIDSSIFSIDTFISVAFYSVLANLVKNIFEEFSWRGYLTPKLMDLKLGDGWIYIISGLVWSLWHAAYYLVFLPEIYFESISRMEMLLSGTVFMLCWTVMYVEIYRLTKSVWSCVFMHAIEDAIPTVLLFTGGYITFTNGSDVWLNPINGILANIFFLLIGLLLRKIRIDRDKGKAF